MTRAAQLPSVAVLIASTGRPQSLALAVDRLRQQTAPPSRIILSVVSAADLPDPALLQGVETVCGPKGLPAQRNTALRQLDGGADVIAFFDDDYVPSRYCIEQIARFFSEHPEVAGANGHLVSDGINSPGIDDRTAMALLADYDRKPAADLAILRSLQGLYGCNMTFRTAATRGLWFDERLKLYGWQEDIDFATQIAKRGRIVKTAAFAGVHQGVKGARTSGVRLGYAQVVNPLYLWRKGTMGRKFAFRIVLRNIAANHARAFRPEPWVDRAGRVRGNWLGLIDAMRGRLTPERIEAL